MCDIKRLLRLTVIIPDHWTILLVTHQNNINKWKMCKTLTITHDLFDLFYAWWCSQYITILLLMTNLVKKWVLDDHQRWTWGWSDFPKPSNYILDNDQISYSLKISKLYPNKHVLQNYWQSVTHRRSHSPLGVIFNQRWERLHIWKVD